MRRKITIVGAGATGATAAQILALRDYADIVLTDIKEGLPQGKALDLNQMGPVLGFEPRITGTNGYEETAGSDVVVITAGLPRSPGMSRDDLVTTNEKIVGSVTEQVVAHSPDCTIVVLSNPLDAMCHVAKRVSGFPKQRVVGQAGILDTARFRTFIAWETGSSVRYVHALVLGGHGDQMVPVASAATVGGVPLRQLVPAGRIEQLVERTRRGRRSPRWSTRSCSTRSASCPARPTSRASTGSTACTSAFRSGSAPAASRRSSSSTSRPTSRRLSNGAPRRCARS